MPLINTCMQNIPFSVFDEIEADIKKSKQLNFIKLHQGKTIFSPIVNLNNWQESGFLLQPHEHASPNGIHQLKEKIFQKLPKFKTLYLNEENILITAGATHAIDVASRTILEPGNEIMILSPQWLFVTGIIKSLNCSPIEVPVFLELNNNSDFNLFAAMSSKLSSKTKAIYFNTPNNPTGYSLNEHQLKEIAFFAEKHDLWIISDNAYENYDFSEHGFLDITEYYDAKYRTFSIYTFSKTFAMPGYRVGYMLVPSRISEETKKRGLYSVYSISTASQYAAFEALNSDVINNYKEKVVSSAKIVSNNLRIPHTKIQGGFYTFLNISEWQKARHSVTFLKECVNNGISLAPGAVFGSHCRDYVRLCFTAVDQEILQTAIERLNDIYVQ